MRAIPPVQILQLDQPQIKLVDERRGLEEVTGTFGAHALPGGAMEFAVDVRCQLLERLLIAAAPGVQQTGDIGVSHLDNELRRVRHYHTLSGGDSDRAPLPL